MLLLIFAACSTRQNAAEETAAAAKTDTRTNYISFTYNGNPVTTDVHSASWVVDENMPVFNVTAFFGDKGQSLYNQSQVAFNIHHLKPETTTVSKFKDLKDKDTSGYLTLTLMEDGKRKDYLNTAPESEFSMNITGFDTGNRTIEGTFSAILYDMNGNKVEVTNGKFFAYYSVVEASGF